jgi:formate hydrogenlyase subunit 3/multisubunit Na+/H+ antiporter MnhD subunit
MPVTGACLRVAALSISGVPPLGGFWSKLFIIVALVLGKMYVLAAVTAVVSFLTLMYYAKVQRYVLGGEPSEAAARAREVPAGMCLASVLLAVLCFASSLMAVPAVRDRVLTPASEAVTAGAETGRDGQMITVPRGGSPHPVRAAESLADGAAGTETRHAEALVGRAEFDVGEAP